MSVSESELDKVRASAIKNAPSTTPKEVALGHKRQNQAGPSRLTQIHLKQPVPSTIKSSNRELSVIQDRSHEWISNANAGLERTLLRQNSDITSRQGSPSDLKLPLLEPENGSNGKNSGKVKGEPLANFPILCSSSVLVDPNRDQNAMTAGPSSKAIEEKLEAMIKSMTCLIDESPGAGAGNEKKPGSRRSFVRDVRP